MQKVLITGAEGYVGRNLCHVLKEMRGFDVRKIDKKTHFDACHLTEWDIEKIDTVVHLAAFSAIENESAYEEIFNDNLYAALKVVSLVKKCDKRLIFFSTSGIHQKDQIGAYVLTKMIGEQIVTDNLDHGVIVRPACIVGAGFAGGFDSTANGHILPRLFYASAFKKEFHINGTGGQIRDYVHVGRLCDTMLQLLVEEGKLQGIMEVYSGKEFTVNSVIDLWRNIIDPELIVVQDGTVRRSDPRCLSQSRIYGQEMREDDLERAMQDYKVCLEDFRRGDVVYEEWPETIGGPGFYHKEYR